VVGQLFNNNHYRASPTPPQPEQLNTLQVPGPGSWNNWIHCRCF